MAATTASTNGWRLHFIGGILVLASGIASASAAWTSEAWMNESEIATALGGHNIAGHYRTGNAFTENYRGDGSLDYSDDNRRSGGHWSVRNGSFCTIYADDPSGGCFRVRRAGANCFEFYFIARTEEGAEHPGQPSWTARGWVEGSPDTCTEGSNV